MSTHATAAGDLRIKRSRAGWSDLPDDLHGVVLSKITSPFDRVRFAAVCKAWREAAPRHPVLPAAPMLLLLPSMRKGTKRLCGPDDSWVFRVPNKVATDKRFVGSHDDGWIAAVDDHALTIMNLFSGQELALSPHQSMISSIGSPTRYDYNICKIIFSGNPASSNGCILVAVTNGRLYITQCRVGSQEAAWRRHSWSWAYIKDIAFCDGQICGLTYPSEQVIKFGIDMRENDMPVFTTVEWSAIRRLAYYNRSTEQYASYIIELHGKLSMAVMTRWLINLDPFIKIFQVVDCDPREGYKHKWAEVTSFGNYALFIGRTWSKAVHVPVGNKRRGLERNHVAYYYEYTSSIANRLLDDAVYSVTLNYGDPIDMCCK